MTGRQSFSRLNVNKLTCGPKKDGYLKSACRSRLFDPSGNKQFSENFDLFSSNGMRIAYSRSWNCSEPHTEEAIQGDFEWRQNWRAADVDRRPRPSIIVWRVEIKSPEKRSCCCRLLKSSLM